MPQPGKVNLNHSSMNRRSPQFSLGGKPKDFKTNEAVPGPGKYGVPNTDNRYRRTLSVSFGSAARISDKKWSGGAPGPGAYSPYDPNQGSPFYGFGSAERLPKKKETTSPSPGQYKLGSSFSKMSCAFGAKPEGKLIASTVPGPGTYGVPDDRQTIKAAPAIPFGSEERLKTLRPPDGPGPGQYPLLNELGGNVTTHISPAYSMKARRPAPRNDSDFAPGPSMTVYSQF
mmetsp:Transcript_96277/g.171015  ORF Transcript_96277/g.171015 Transcript_96277/m.171015 type:complete len:229 (-) Transcript_96277:141-827(-)|eukprot:CAMPEP_0197646864 /NCGR_PEP_ID=MMETSP1338-20131121/23901_1 /TAXON_ID=43686 ORGANISM="Pelagodinium beii, Strain RCC1491" /NCGR_SAMPLE_ID=MMETSP1338 /ASSEMBLY_ACC=CAM_ASM_000754 /LENGTH=228 /DNA_ID=CAMNT_0043220545 /DNA_START=104 /DNA_END=790 /DNA_ORIENTATION=+